MSSSAEELVQRIWRDLADSCDEELELELEDRNQDQLAGSGVDTGSSQYRESRRQYFDALFRMQGELVKLQDWVVRTGHKQWKLSPMDLESRRRWEEYTKAKEVMMERTHISEAPWWVVQAVDKKKARLNCIHHLLGQLAYQEVERPAIVLPPRVRHDDYVRRPVPQEILVPEIY